MPPSTTASTMASTTAFAPPHRFASNYPSRSARRSSVPAFAASASVSDPVVAHAPDPVSVSAPAPAPADAAQLLQLAIEQLCDGLVVITTEGQVVAANQAAHQICAHGTADSAEASVPSALQLPVSVWQQCQQIMQQGELQSGQQKIPEFELILADSIHLRVRLRWLEAAFVASEQQSPLLLITLEERNQSLSKLYQANFSDREKQVWQLRIQGYSYQDIADQLYITINTVKKHIKNIRAKQRLFEAAN